MAYDTAELKKRALNLIKENNLFFHSDVFNLLGIVSSTYYLHFPSDSEDYQDLNLALLQNRANTKNSLRSKWYKSDNSTQTIALYKLIATDDERKRLSQTYTDITSNGDSVFTAPEINFNVVSPDPVEVQTESDGGEAKPRE